MLVSGKSCHLSMLIMLIILINYCSDSNSNFSFTSELVGGKKNARVHD
jgi:hypothetical protein